MLLLQLGHEHRPVSLTPGLSYVLYVSGKGIVRTIYCSIRLIDLYTAARGYGRTACRAPHNSGRYTFCQLSRDYGDRATQSRISWLPRSTKWPSGLRHRIVIYHHQVHATRQYTIVLHDFCAKRGCAHESFHRRFETLQVPGGWYAIATQYIEDSNAIQMLTHKMLPVYLQSYRRI